MVPELFESGFEEAEMKIPNYRPVTRQDVQEADPWLDKALKPINRQILDLTGAIQGKASLGENTNCEIIELTVTHEKDYFVVPKTLRDQPLGAVCVYSVRRQALPMDSEIMNDGRIRLRFSFTVTTGESFVRVLLVGA